MYIIIYPKLKSEFVQIYYLFLTNYGKKGKVICEKNVYHNAP